MKTDELLAMVLALPAAERAELAYALLESLHGEGDADAEGAWVEELEKRAEAVEDGTAELVEWDEVRARVATRLKARRGGGG